MVTVSETKSSSNLYFLLQNQAQTGSCGLFALTIIIVFLL